MRLLLISFYVVNEISKHEMIFCGEVEGKNGGTGSSGMAPRIMLSYF